MKNKAPRNKTIELTAKEIGQYAKKTIKLSALVDLSQVLNKTICQDAFKALDFLPANSVDLLIVDPPYNLTKNFAGTIFKEMGLDDYKVWLDKWLK